MNVEELMSRNPKTCSSTDHLGKAARLMWDHDIGCVPVVDERGHATGIVTDRDLCMAALLKERELTAIRVGTVMARQLVTCMASDPLAYAERLMKEYQVRRLLVTDAFGRLVGMISQNDLVREAARESAVRRSERELSEHEVMDTLAAIGARRHQMIDMAR